MTPIPNQEKGMRVLSCPDCEAACLRMKAQGFRPWRRKFACFEHAAVSWDEWCAERGITFDDAPATAQPDLFATPTQHGAAA